MKLKPIHDRVLILPHAEPVMIGSVLIPEDARMAHRMTRGVVIDSGPGAWAPGPEGKIIWHPMVLLAGDEVVYDEDAPQGIEGVDGFPRVRLKLIRMNDVKGRFGSQGKITPLKDHVYFKPIRIEVVAGIHLPMATEFQPCRLAWVVAIGADVKHVKVRDVVIYDVRYAVLLRVDGDEYYSLHEPFIQAVREDLSGLTNWAEVQLRCTRETLPRSIKSPA